MSLPDDVTLQVMRTKALAEDVMHQARLLTPDQGEQLGALLTAATALLEQMVGPGRAADLLMTMLAPTLVDWQATMHRTIQ